MRKIYIFFTVFVLSYHLYSQENKADSGVYFLILKNKLELFGIFLEKTEEKIVFSDIFIQKIEIPSSQIEETTIVYPNTLCVFKTNTGKIFEGYFLKLDKEEICFLDNPKGKTILKISQLKSVIPVKLSDITQKNVLLNEQKNIYYSFGKSLVPLRKGEMYYQNNALIANAAHFRIGGNASIGVGTFFIPFPFIFEFSFLYVNPQVGFLVAKNLYVGGGIWGFYNYFAGRSLSFIGYGMITYGNERSNISVCIGANTQYTNYDGSFKYKYPFASLSGALYLSPTASLITENVLLALTPIETFSTFSVGIRTGKNNHSFDFGVKIIGIETQFLPFPVPYLGYSLRIKTRKE